MPLRFLAIALLVPFAGMALGQISFDVTQQPPPGQQSAVRRTLTGSVANSVTGEPIRRALVRVNGPTASSAFTGADGRFEIPNVPEGQLVVTAQKPGFFSPGSSGGLPQGSWTFFSGGNGNFTRQMAGGGILVTLGPATGDLVIKLDPEAKIRGRVLDKNGEPIEGLNVQLLAREIMAGRQQWQHRGAATTDETGTYLLDGLMPGLYAIHSVPLIAPNSGAPGVVTQETAAEVYPSSYYPDSPDLSSVQAFDVTAGQDLSVDFTLSPVRAFRVSGVVGGAPGQLMIVCEDGEGQPVSSERSFDSRTGKFTISGIPAGAWVVHAVSQHNMGQEGALEAEQPIEVRASDVSGLVLRLQQLPSIAVHVENGSAGQQPMVSLAPVGMTQGRQYYAQNANGDSGGVTTIHGVPPGSYRASVQAVGPPGCVGSVMSGGTDLNRDELTVGAGSQPAPIEVTLRNDCASIAGTVASSGVQAVSGFVILAGDSAAYSPGPIPVGTDGKFTIPNVTPGSYRLYAFNDVKGLEYANPEAMKDFSGKDLTVGPNEKGSVQLDLITRGH